jgi:hypothetical protein
VHQLDAGFVPGGPFGGAVGDQSGDGEVSLAIGLRRPVYRWSGRHCRTSALACSTQIRREDWRRFISRQPYRSVTGSSFGAFMPFGFLGGALTWSGNSFARPR